MRDQRPPAGRDRRLAERRSGIDRRMLRGRVVHDRRRGPREEPPAAKGDDTDQPTTPVVQLEDNPGRVRPVIGFPPRGTRSSRPWITTERALMIAIAALMIALVIVMGALVL